MPLSHLSQASKAFCVDSFKSLFFIVNRCFHNLYSFTDFRVAPLAPIDLKKIGIYENLMLLYSCLGGKNYELYKSKKYINE